MFKEATAAVSAEINYFRRRSRKSFTLPLISYRPTLSQIVMPTPEEVDAWWASKSKSKDGVSTPPDPRGRAPDRNHYYCYDRQAWVKWEPDHNHVYYYDRQAWVKWERTPLLSTRMTSTSNPWREPEPEPEPGAPAPGPRGRT